MSTLEEAIHGYLLNALKSEDPGERQEATRGLWERWFDARGPQAKRTLFEASRLIEQRALMRAEDHLTQLIRRYPDFAEAYNQRAIARYLMEHWHDAIGDCQEAVALNPDHFGALHGLGLCSMAIEDYPTALAAFRAACEIQPYVLINRQLIAECLSRLS